MKTSIESLCAGLARQDVTQSRRHRHRIPVRRVGPVPHQYGMLSFRSNPCAQGWPDLLHDVRALGNIESLCAGLARTPPNQRQRMQYRIPVRRVGPETRHERRQHHQSNPCAQGWPATFGITSLNPAIKSLCAGLIRSFFAILHSMANRIPVRRVDPSLYELQCWMEKSNPCAQG